MLYNVISTFWSTWFPAGFRPELIAYLSTVTIVVLIGSLVSALAYLFGYRGKLPYVTLVILVATLSIIEFGGFGGLVS